MGRKPTQLSEEDIQNILEDYKNGMKIFHISQKYKKNYEKVRKILCEHGLVAINPAPKIIATMEPVVVVQKVKYTGVPVAFHGKQYYDISHFPIFGLNTKKIGGINHESTVHR